MKYAILLISLKTKENANDVIEMSEDPDVFVTPMETKEDEIHNLLDKNFSVKVYIPKNELNQYRVYIDKYYAVDVVEDLDLPYDIEEITVKVRQDIKQLLQLAPEIDKILMKYFHLNTGNVSDYLDDDYNAEHFYTNNTGGFDDVDYHIA